MCVCRGLHFAGCLACCAVLFPLLSATAGWGHRHHCAGSASSAGGFAASAPTTNGFTASAPASAPAAPAYAPTYYYVAPFAAMPQAAPQAAPLVGQLREAFEIIKVISELRNELRGGVTGPGTGTEPPPVTASADLREVQAALARLEGGQADLRGRLINAAGVHQAIGKTVVEIHQATNDPEGQVIKRLDEIIKKLPAPPAPGAAPPQPPTPAKATHQEPHTSSPTYVVEAPWVQRR
jgi:hypothetical protein